jgi:5-methylthioadenosine/S-adenosylhomocysteine deaminase
MDMNDLFPRLKETRAASLKTTRDLAEYWHGSYGERIRYAVAPRFVLSCTDGLMQDAFAMLEHFPGMLFHTHASENTSELQSVIARCGMRNVEFLDRIGVLSGRTCLAHCIHVNDKEIDLLQRAGASVAHCPSSNLKLGSGIAPIPALLERGITVSLGADGAPCNNTLNMFQEMRLASLMQKSLHGPQAMNARTVFEMATLGGARALGLGEEIGSIEAGKKADLVILNLERVWNPTDPGADIYSTIVYSAGPENIESVMIDGRWVYRNGEYVDIDEEKTMARARSELTKLLKRL